MLCRMVGIAVVLLVFGSAPTFAQDATVTGTVTDASKGVLPGVSVTATDVGNGRQFSAVTDERGEYRLAGMPAGRYRVQAELTGFATSVVPELELLVGQNATARFTLQVATLNETLTVTGEAPLIDVRSAQIAGNVDRRQMEELPIQGRNWMELSMMVKGVTANDVGNNRPGVVRDTQFQLSLDGQQITQQLSWASIFGQPGVSREAIAEYQIVTNLFDITMGRSTGLQVQAVSRAGSNTLAGSVYGYFRDEKFNAADFVAKRVLPYANQQAGVTLGGPILKDKLHYFGSFEYEREPNTLVLAPPPLAPQRISLPTKTDQQSFLGRVDYQLSAADHLMVRNIYYRRYNPFEELAGANHPSQGTDRIRDSKITTVNWSRVINANLLQEVKIGHYNYHWVFKPSVLMPLTPEYRFPGLLVGARWNYPEEFGQNTPSARYDLTWHKGKHDLKIGGEYLRGSMTGWWRARSRGQFFFSSLPADFARRFPLDAWNDPSRWDLSGLDPLVLRFDQYYAREGGQNKGNGDWSFDIPRPTYAVWIGDTWSVRNNLTLTLGVRYDLDRGATAPPLVRDTEVLIDNGRDPVQNVGYRSDIRDVNNIAPRVGFSWNVTGNSDLVIRGGSGLYYATPSAEPAFSQQLFNAQRVITNSYVNDGRPGFLQDPTRGVTAEDILDGRVPLSPQAVTVLAHDYEMPYTVQTAFGFQKQLTDVMAFDADLVHWRAYHEGTARDPNLFYDPATGFNKPPNRFGRPNPAYGPIQLYESTGRSDYMALATSFTRRYRNNFQAGLTYTLMFYKHDNGPGQAGFGGPGNNQLNREAEWARSADFQRHTVRANGIFRLPWDLSLSGSFAFGSGNYFTTTSGVDPFGSASTRVRSDLSVIPRNNFKGKPLQKLDLRISKEIPLVGNVKLSGILEVFNVLNHANYGSYNGLETSPSYQQPTQNLSTSYLPRVMQLAFKVSF